MTWYGKAAPSSPTDIKVVSDGNTETIQWSGACNNNDSPYLLYNVYASEDYPVDIANPKNIIATRLMGNSIQLIASGKDLNYAVTAVDRYGNESTPFTYGHGESKAKLLKCNGILLTVPERDKSCDADMLLVKDMAGKNVSTIYRSNEVSVYDLADGMYQLYSLDRRGTIHRIGFF